MDPYSSSMYQQQQQQQQDYPPNRSPGSTRGYNGIPSMPALNRQPSRLFQHPYDTASQVQYAPSYPQQRYEQEPPPQTNYRMQTSTAMNNYDSQTWSNYGGGAAIGTNTMGGTGRMKTPNRSRPPIPSPWLDTDMGDVINGYGDQHAQMLVADSLQMMRQGPNANGLYQTRPVAVVAPHRNGEEPEANIMTAIVIKNIPFAVKKEQLQDIMINKGLPVPYAFNYHFDQGIFRGLAFANFQNEHETELVIHAMNHMELQGRKLRVEYKRMLPVADRDRIEREKRERRGQLQEQHQPMPQAQVRSQASMGSMSSQLPPSSSPAPHFNQAALEEAVAKGEIDMNNARTWGWHHEMLLFKQDESRASLRFPHNLTRIDRRTIHVLAHVMGLQHSSQGDDDLRQITVTKREAPILPTSQLPQPPTLSQVPSFNSHEQRRGLNRAATVDFSEVRESSNNFFGTQTLGHRASGLLDIPASPGPYNTQPLRTAKSFADLRYNSPSPSHTTYSFPESLANNVSRYSDFQGQNHGSATSGTPNLTPTSASREDPSLGPLLNGMSSLAFDRPSYRSNGSSSTIRPHERETHAPITAIGSQRPGNGKYEENTRNGSSNIERPDRQPKGPDRSNGQGFTRPRQNGHMNRGSGEHDFSGLTPGWDDNRTQDSSDRSNNTPQYQ